MLYASYFLVNRPEKYIYLLACKTNATIFIFLGTANPENSCFCNGECIPTGVLNVSSCTMDSPTFLSLPHFYNADPYYVNAVEGLQPDEEKHEFFFTLEPVGTEPSG